jgi:hypothetical protein
MLIKIKIIPATFDAVRDSLKNNTPISTTIRKFNPTAKGYANEISMRDKALIHTKADKNIAITALNANGDFSNTKKYFIVFKIESKGTLPI